MSRTKGARDLKKRKKETKPRDGFGYFLRYQRQMENQVRLFDFTPKELQDLKVKYLWQQLDCIRNNRTEEYRIKGHKRKLFFRVPRCRFIEKRCPRYLYGWPWRLRGFKFKHWKRRYKALMCVLLKREVSDREVEEWLEREQTDFYWEMVQKQLRLIFEQEKTDKIFKQEEEIVKELESLGCPVPRRRIG